MDWASTTSSLADRGFGGEFPRQAVGNDCQSFWNIGSSSLACRRSPFDRTRRATYPDTESSIDGSIGSEISPDTNVAMTFMAHNTTPSAGAQISPIFALTGRPGIIEELPKASAAKTSGERYDCEELAFWKRMITVQDDRAKIMTFGAKRTGRNCLIRHAQVDSA